MSYHRQKHSCARLLLFIFITIFWGGCFLCRFDLVCCSLHRHLLKNLKTAEREWFPGIRIFFFFLCVLPFCPCPGQCDPARVCKPEEALRGLDQILRLHHELVPNTWPNLANAAGKEVQRVSNFFPDYSGSVTVAWKFGDKLYSGPRLVSAVEYWCCSLSHLHSLPIVRIPSAIPLCKTSLRCRQTSMSAKWRRHSATSVSEHLKVLLL